jgi:hypothetical protein
LKLKITKQKGESKENSFRYENMSIEMHEGVRKMLTVASKELKQRALTAVTERKRTCLFLQGSAASTEKRPEPGREEFDKTFLPQAPRLDQDCHDSHRRKGLGDRKSPQDLEPDRPRLDLCSTRSRKKVPSKPQRDMKKLDLPKTQILVPR